MFVTMIVTVIRLIAAGTVYGKGEQGEHDHRKDYSS